MALERVTRKRRCRICDKPDYCSFDSQTNLAICMRVSHGAKGGARNGGWIHPFGESNEKLLQLVRQAAASAAVAPPPSSFIKKISAKASPSSAHIDQVYAMFLDRLSLSQEHWGLLNERGLSDLAVGINEYRTMPSQRKASIIARELLSEDYALDGVPGFYFEKGSWHFQTYGLSGYLIPIRNHKGEIVALTLRKDSADKRKYMLVSSSSKFKGTSSGAPAHFSTQTNIPSLEKIESVIVTEGALKADVIAYFLKQPVVGLVGVGCFNENFPELLSEAFPSLKTISIAFDMDSISNQMVRHQRDRLIQTLKTQFKVEVLTWNAAHKGFDDYLLAQRNPESSKPREFKPVFDSLTIAASAPAASAPARGIIFNTGGLNV